MQREKYYYFMVSLLQFEYFIYLPLCLIESKSFHVQIFHKYLNIRSLITTVPFLTLHLCNKVLN